MNTQELQALKASIDRSLALIGERSSLPGFEREMYEQLVRMRELLRQIRPELFHDDKLPSEKSVAAPPPYRQLN